MIRIEIVKKTDLPVKEINMELLQGILDFFDKIPFPVSLVKGLLSNKTVEISYDVKILFGGKDNPISNEIRGKNAFLIKSEK